MPALAGICSRIGWLSKVAWFWHCSVSARSGSQVRSDARLVQTDLGSASEGFGYRDLSKSSVNRPYVQVERVGSPDRTSSM